MGKLKNGGWLHIDWPIIAKTMPVDVDYEHFDTERIDYSCVQKTLNAFYEYYSLFVDFFIRN